MWYAVEPPLGALRSLPQAAECTNDAPMSGVEDAVLSTCEQVARCEQEKLRNTCRTKHTATNQHAKVHLGERIVDEHVSSTAQGLPLRLRLTGPWCV